MATKKNGAGTAAARVETEKRRCQIKLTLAERDKRGDEMADCEIKIEELKGERSELARQVKTYEKRRNELGHALEAGTEERELQCSWVPDFKQNAFLLTRPDTQEVIDTRPMTATDRQTDLPGADVHALHAPPPAPPPRSPAPRKRGRPPKLAAVPDATPAA
jgi:hypothetical protein